MARDADFELRDATPADLPGIVEIFNDIVATSTAVYYFEPVDVAERRVWFDGRLEAGYPVLVMTAGGKVAGFASFGRWRGPPGYDFTVEHSVHVHAERRGQGVGRALLGALIERARAMGKHVMIGGIDADNAASLALHQRLGFTQAALHRQVGRKFDRWLDLVFVELRL